MLNYRILHWNLSLETPSSNCRFGSLRASSLFGYFEREFFWTQAARGLGRGRASSPPAKNSGWDKRCKEIEVPLWRMWRIHTWIGIARCLSCKSTGIDKNNSSGTDLTKENASKRNPEKEDSTIPEGSSFIRTPSFFLLLHLHHLQYDTYITYIRTPSHCSQHLWMMKQVWENATHVYYLWRITTHVYL